MIFLSLFKLSAKNVQADVDSLVDLGRFDEALKKVELALKSETKAIELTRLKATKSYLLALNGEISSSFNLLESVIWNDFQETSPKLDMALAYLFCGKTFESAQIMEKVDYSNLKDESTLFKYFKTKGLVSWAQLQFSQAEENFEQAFQLCLKKYGKNNTRTAACLQNLALVKQTTDAKQSKILYFEVLNIFSNTNAEFTPTLQSVFENLGMLYFEEGKIDSSLFYHEKAFQTAEKIYPATHPTKAFILNNMGRAETELKKFGTANAKHLNALGIYELLHGKKHPEIANTYFLMALNFEEQKKFSEAFGCIEKGFESITKSNHWQRENRLPSTDEVEHLPTYLGGLISKAKIHEQKHLKHDLKRGDLISAISCYSMADSVIFEIRKRTNSGKDKLQLSSQAREVYENAVSICATLKESSLSPKKWAMKAFYFCERNKAFSLLEAMNDNKAKSFAGIPDSLTKQERKLKEEISFLERLIIESKDVSALNRKKLMDSNGQLMKLTKNLEANYPNYYRLKYQIPKLTENDLDKLTEGNKIAVDYFLNSSRRESFAFKIKEGKLKMIVLPTDNMSMKVLKSFRNSIIQKNKRVFMNRSHEVYNQFVKPLKLKASDKELLIIPDGELHAIPFEALLKTKPKKGEGYKDFDYLIKTKQVSYGFSLHLNAMTEQKGMLERNWAAFAPVQFKQANNLSGTLKEVMAIDSILKKTDTQIFVNHEASVSNFRQLNLKRFWAIHLATHGLVDEIEPEKSRLFFHGKEKDDFLYVPDIYGMEINTELVFLSACQTGLGKVNKGDGLLGLSRAFAYAGARRLVVSLWNVNDEAAVELTMAFYSAVVAKKSFSQALRESKLKLIENEESANPYYWAPFVLISK